MSQEAILKGQPLGSGAKFSAFVMCLGKQPATFDEVQEHFRDCEKCQREVDKYNVDIHSDKYQNKN